MMIRIINGVSVNYLDYGQGEEALVLLHGWGQNVEMMKPIGDRFKKNNRIIIIDLPGFGLSDEPKNIWTLNDYVECIKKLLNELNINKPILIGHSFGGKISLLYASMYEVTKLILFGSPFKKEIKKLSFKTKTLKFLKTVPLINKLEGFAKKHIGSTDYKKASETMRKILVEHVNLDIEEEVKKIKCPTLLVWGTMDTEVPVERAYELEKIISDAGVVVYEGCSHYAYLERLDQTIKIISSFIGG